MTRTKGLSWRVRILEVVGGVTACPNWYRSVLCSWVGLGWVGGGEGEQIYSLKLRRVTQLPGTSLGYCKAFRTKKSLKNTNSMFHKFLKETSQQTKQYGGVFLQYITTQTSI
jgi:hypothetical protein